MADPYQIRIPEHLYAEISRWGLAADVRRAMERRLREQMARDPVHYLQRVRNPWGEPLNVFDFTLPDPVDPSAAYLFQISVVYGEDEKTIDVLDVGFQRVENGTGDGPDRLTS